MSLSPVRQDNPVCEGDRICDFGPAEAAVDDLPFREILGQRFPQADARTAHKQDRIAWRRIGFVRRFKGGNRGFPFRAAGVGFAAGRGAPPSRQEADQQ